MTLERFRNAVLAVCILAWGYFASLGYGRIAGLAVPTIGQVILYFVIPASFTIGALFVLIYRLRLPFRRLDALLLAAPVILFPLYVLTRT